MAMSRKEETAMFARYRAGDKSVRNKIVEANIPFIYYIVKGYPTNTPKDDLVHEGVIGMIEAVDRFDSSMGVKFLTFAVWYIKKRICRYIEDKSDVVRVSSNLRTKMYKSGNAPKYTSDVTFFSSDRTDDDDLDDKKISDIIKNAIKKLPAQNATIINQLYGLLNDTPTNLRSVGSNLGLSGEWVRQINKSTLKTLKRSLKCLDR